MIEYILLSLYTMNIVQNEGTIWYSDSEFLDNYCLFSLQRFENDILLFFFKWCFKISSLFLDMAHFNYCLTSKWMYIFFFDISIWVYFKLKYSWFTIFQVIMYFQCHVHFQNKSSTFPMIWLNVIVHNTDFHV